MRLARIAHAGAALAVIAATAAVLVRAPATPAVAGTAPPVVVAAGDIACEPGSSQFNAGNGTAKACAGRRTSNQALRMAPAAVLPLGDLQYDDGRLWKFRRSYDPSWGRLLTDPVTAAPLTYPAVGNHEYGTAAAIGYFDYFNGRNVPGTPGLPPTGDRSEGWYSFDVGDWHLISLNANCEELPDGCGQTSAQVVWLSNDLALHPNKCVLAYWHQPRFSSGLHGNDSSVRWFWSVLHAAGADVVLNGHDHDYEHFSPQDPQKNFDPAYGIREFVVGTGGAGLRRFRSNPAPNSWRRDSSDFGVLKLTLMSDRYRWRFAPASRTSTFSDTGSRACHDAPPPPPPPGP